MAYREFYEKDNVIVPDYSPIERGIANFWQGIGSVYEDRKKKSDQYKYALDYGKFENDNKFLENYVGGVIKLGKSDFRNQGSPSNQLLQMEEQGRRYKADMDAQYKRFTDLNDRINKRATEDAYYDPEIDKKTLEGAAFGDGDIDFRTRGGRLDDASQFIGSDPRSFRLDNYTADYIKNRGTKEMETRSPLGADGSRTYSYKTPFVDPKTGKPGVTNEHAIEFLHSKPDVLARMQWDVDQDLLDDVEGIVQLAKKNDGRAKWAKGMEPEEVLMQIKTNGNLNPFEKTNYNDLVLNKAKKKLTDMSDIAQKTLVDYKKSSGEGSVTNDNIGHSETFHNNATNVSLPGGLGPQNPNAAKNVAGPGGLLMIKKGVSAGKPIVIEAASRNAYNYATGKSSRRPGASKFNLTGYQLVPYTSEGRLFPIEASNTDELKQKIEAMSPEQMRQMAPNMSVAMQGYSVDDSKFLSDISNRSLKLSEELGDAIENGDTQLQNKLQQQIDQLKQLQNVYNSNTLSDDDISNLAAQSGIKSIRNDQLIQAEPNDLDKIKTITGGLDLKDKSKWNQDMRDVDALWTKKWTEAQSAPVTKEKKAITVIESDGSDVDSWKQSSEYKVGGATYYYDKSAGEWKKK